jgi:transcriptional regulator with XRE-family HTH domain
MGVQMQTRIASSTEFGQMVRLARREQKMSQAQLSEFFASFSREFLSDLENGKPTVELEKALSVAHALGLRIYLATDDCPSTDTPKL